MTDALGNPVRFILTGGNEADCTQALPLLADIQAGAVLGDKGYDTDAILEGITRVSALAVIPPKANRRAMQENG